MATAEKPARPKSKLLQLLPKAASAFSFHNPPPFSPGRDKKRLEFRSHVRRIVSMIPAEARRRTRDSSFRAEEPSSPKVSCMGQVKRRKNKNKDKNKDKVAVVTKRPQKSFSMPKDIKTASLPLPRETNKKEKEKKKKKKSSIMNLFGGGKQGRRSDESAGRSDQISEKAPSLGTMKRFASGRDKLSNFDWTAQIIPVESDHRDYYSDNDYSEGEYEEEEEEEEVIIPFSAPIMMNRGGINGIEGVNVEPRKEINLWKRRTMAQPRPLQLNPLVVSN